MANPSLPPLDPNSIKGDELQRFIDTGNMFEGTHLRHRFGSYVFKGDEGVGPQNHEIDLLVLDKNSIVLGGVFTHDACVDQASTFTVGTTIDADAFINGESAQNARVAMFGQGPNGVLDTDGVRLNNAPVYVRVNLDYPTGNIQAGAVIRVFLIIILYPAFMEF